MSHCGLYTYVIMDSLASRLCEHCLSCVHDLLFLGSLWTTFLWVPEEDSMTVVF